MKQGPDRRQVRRRLFEIAGAILLVALVAGLLLWLLVSSLAGLLSVLIGLAAAAAILHRPRGVPILVYHSVSPDAGWLPWAKNTSVRPETFRRHLETIRRARWTVISTRAFVADRRAGMPVRDRTLLLHFDDGYLDNHLFAVPILREFGMPATFFVSTDFVEPGDTIRTSAADSDPARWRGYMNAAELRAIDADPLFDIEAHGTDHGRIPVSDRVVDRLTDSNWRRHAPIAWACDPGNKSRWYQAEGPPPSLRPGDAIPETDSALAGRRWHNGRAETDTAFARRVSAVLIRSRHVLGQILARPPEIFAWPFDRACPVGIAAAYDAGFSAVTGGLGENRPDEDPALLSRVHVQDKAFGGGPLWLEGLALRARMNSASGRHAWHGVVALAARLRRRRFAPSVYGLL